MMPEDEQIESRIWKLEDKELNNLALNLEHPNAKKGIQAPLGVKVTARQRKNFIQWIKGTGNLEKAGIHLRILPDPELRARDKEAERQRKLDQAAIDQAQAAKSQVRIAWIALIVSIVAIVISIVALFKR